MQLNHSLIIVLWKLKYYDNMIKENVIIIRTFAGLKNVKAFKDINAMQLKPAT